MFPLSIYAQEDSLKLPLSHKQNILSAELNTGYYESDKNYTQLSSTEDLYNKSSFRYLNADLNLIYTPNKWFEVKAFINGFWFKIQNKNEYYTLPTINRAGVLLRTQQPLSNYFGVIPELSMSMPLFSMSKPFDFNNNMNSFHVTPSIWLYGSFNNIYPFMHLGLKMRSYKMSFLLQSKVGIMLKKNITEIGFYAYGFYSIFNKFSQNESDDTQKNLNEGSLKFSSYNPSVLGFTTWVGCNLQYISLRIYGDLDINGINYGKGFNVLASVIFNLNTRISKVQKIFSDDDEYIDDQITEDEQTVNTFFKNSNNDAKLQQEAENELNKANTLEENKN